MVESIGAGEVVDGALGELEELARIGEQPWRVRRRCNGVSPRMFFPARGEPAEAAKAVCHGCAVRRECLGDALARHEGAGVWGGYTTDERRRFLRHYHGLGPHEIVERLG